MNFNDKKAIYHQIADLVCDKILKDEWTPESRILSVRELGVKIEVNPNTVLRAYDLLQQKGIITNKRGVGYFCTSDAKIRVLDLRKEEFIEEEIPALRRNLTLLGINFDELKRLLET